MSMREVSILFGAERLTLRVPARADILTGPDIPRLEDPQAAVLAALQQPIASPSLRELAEKQRPASVVITMSDITRPVPNELLITAILAELHAAGVDDDACTILIATGMHRPSTPREREIMLGTDLLRRCRVVDHEAGKQDSLVSISEDPPVSINRIYADAELKIVTGLIEPHFMAGYSGGRKGICPGLVDLRTVQRFHGHKTMGDPLAVEGKLVGNPCHEIAMRVAGLMGCDFLVNAAITHERKLAGVFAGQMVAAHQIGCEQVGAWTSAHVDRPYDLVVQSAGGYPLDESFYQTVKGMVTALPALHDDSILLMCSACTEVGSPEYTDLMMQRGSDFRGFLDHIRATEVTAKDQWQYQMQTRVLERIGVERLVLANDGLPIDVQRKLAVTPAPGVGNVAARAQQVIDELLQRTPDARIAVIPEGPYTMLRTERVR
jgi:nickel-dependent lactate racemase